MLLARHMRLLLWIWLAHYMLEACFPDVHVN